MKRIKGGMVASDLVLELALKRLPSWELHKLRADIDQAIRQRLIAQEHTEAQALREARRPVLMEQHSRAEEGPRRRCTTCGVSFRTNNDPARRRSICKQCRRGPRPTKKR